MNTTDNPDQAVDDAQTPAPPELLAGRARQLIRQSLMQRFSAFLKPGEKLDIEAEQSAEYVWARIRMTRVDESFQLDIEASILAADQKGGAAWDATRYLELGIEFLKLQLYEFFRQDRDERFHVDWRIYPVETLILRFRGQITKPSVEREADALLEVSELSEENETIVLEHDPSEQD